MNPPKAFIEQCSLNNDIHDSFKRSEKKVLFDNKHAGMRLMMEKNIICV